MVEKIEKCVCVGWGGLPFSGYFMVLMSTLKEGCCGMNWQDCLVSGIFCDAVGAIYQRLSRFL